MGEGVTRAGWAEKAALVFSSVPVGLAFSALSPVLPKMVTAFADYPNAPVLVKQLVGIIGVAMVIGCPLGGWLARRVQHRLLIGLSYLFFGLAGCLGLFLSDLYLLLASRVVVGTCAAILVTVSLIAISVRISDAQRASFLGISVALSMVGALSAYLLGGFLGGMGWRVPFAIHLITLPFAAACLFVPKGEVTTAAPEAATASTTSLPIRLPALAFLGGLVMFLPPIYIPFQLRDVGTDDPQTIALYLAFSTVIGVVASSLYGRLRTRLDIYQSLALALALVASGLGLLAFAATTAEAVFAMLVYGSGLGHIAPNIYALLAQVPEPERARTVGFAQGIKFIAPPAGVFVLEPIMKAGGADATLIALAMVGYLMMTYVLIDRVPFSARTPETADT